MKRWSLTASPSAFRSMKMVWVRLDSSTTASGHTSRSSSSLPTTRPACRTRTSSVSKAFEVTGTTSRSRINSRVATWRANGPNW